MHTTIFITMLISVTSLYPKAMIYAKHNQGWKKYFIFWDRNEKWEHFLRVVDTNPV
jgi:hypothetical protein